jgi:hypothetical protein
MNGGLDLEQRYRRVLRLLPGYYRATWEQDMVAAFLDSWLTGDPEQDECILEFCKPTWEEVASVAALAVRLYLGGAAAPRRYYAWGQAVRGAVLAVMLFHAVRGIDVLVRSVPSRPLPAPVMSSAPVSTPVPVPAGSAVIVPPVTTATLPPGGLWPATVMHLLNYLINYGWIVIFVALALRYYRSARVIGVLVVATDLVLLVHAQLTGTMRAPYGDWAFWGLVDVAPLLAMGAFHRDAPPTARWPWLLALPAGYLLVPLPVWIIQQHGNPAWLPDGPGLLCLLVALACLAHAPRARSRQATGSGVWSLTTMLLAAVAGAYRVFSLGDYLHDPHMINVSLAELLILAAAVALVAPDAARAQTATPAPPPRPHPG